MNRRMDVHQLNWKIHELIDGLATRMDRAVVEQIREYVEHDEQGIAVDDLAGYLLLERTPVYVDERATLRELFDHFGAVSGQALPHIYGSADVLDTLDLIELTGSPLPTRGIASIRDTAKLSTKWTKLQIRDAGSLVARSPRRTRLPNNRIWATGMVDGVQIGVLGGANGELRAVLSLESPDTHRKPHAADIEHPRLVELLSETIYLGCAAALSRSTGGLPTAEAEVLTALLRAGELEEMADSLAARVVADDEMISMESYRGIRMMLCGFDLPVPGCEFINDRSTVLARLRVSG